MMKNTIKGVQYHYMPVLLSLFKSIKKGNKREIPVYVTADDDTFCIINAITL